MNSNNEPLISVIVVAYNYAALLPRALEAIKAQSFHDYEIVLVNNGSTDNTQEIIDQFVSENSQISISLVKIEKNTGLVNGRNKGIEAACGQYIMFNDADDWMKENCLEELSKYALQGADKVCGSFEEIDTAGNKLRTCSFCKNQSKWFTVSLQATLFRRSIIEEHNLRFHETWLDDIDFNTHFNYYAKKVSYTNVPVYNYYVNLLSTSGAKVKKRSWTYLDLQRDMLTFFVPMIEKLEGQDKKDLYYLMIKQYYFYMLHSNRYSTWPEMKKYYNDAHSMMLSFLPDYLKGHRVKLFEDNGDRPSGRHLTWLFYSAEKCHMYKLLLRLFLIVSKVKYLNP